MGKLYPVEQRHRDAAAKLAPCNTMAEGVRVAEIRDGMRDDHPLVQAFARFEAEHLTRIEATPAVDRETLKRAIADGYSGGNEQYDEAPSHVQALYDMAVDAITALPPVKQSDGLAERVREACAAEAEKAIRAHSDAHGPSGGAWNISMVLAAVLPAIRSLDITRMDSDEQV